MARSDRVQQLLDVAESLAEHALDTGRVPGLDGYRRQIEEILDAPPSDGAIYQAYSERANPEAHAQVRQLQERLGQALDPNKEA